MARQDIELQNELEPKRLAYAKEQIEKLGFPIIFETKRELHFLFLGHTVKFYPYSGWHTGKSIKDGRGLQNLLNQIKFKP